MSLDKRIFDIIFGRMSEGDGDPTKLLYKLMDPGFDYFLEKKGEAIKELETLPYENMSIETPDSVTLRARLYGQGDKNITAILIHGYNSYGIRDHADSALYYISRGFRVLIPDNRGCGESGGSFQSFGIYESRDSALWVKLINERFPDGKVFIQGCSLGGATVCLMSCMDLGGNVLGIVSDCAFARVPETLSHVMKVIVGLEPSIFLNVVERAFTKYTGEDLEKTTPISAVREARYPVLFIHGSEDAYINSDNSRQLFEECASEKQLVLIDGAGHAASSIKDPERYFSTVISFINEKAEA